MLADLQTNYSEQYHKLQEINSNPEMIGDMTLSLPSEAKDALILIMLKASKLGRKSQKLFEMTPDEQRQYAKELINYAEFVESKSKEMKQLKEKQKGEQK
jgi:hypothetical protein